MKMKKAIFLLALLIVCVCSGCGSEGRELKVGVYNDHDEIVLDKQKTVTDPEVIDKVKRIFEDRSTRTSQAEGKPDYVVIINNREASTMERGVELWEQADGTMIAGPLFGGKETYSISQTHVQDIKSWLDLSS
ncbi:hypothetical protein B9G55_14710 [Saccharibacillus sp. O16]|nr:hypothetical protein B9G55_14710 [Saccharibacillus sp. O16]